MSRKTPNSLTLDFAVKAFLLDGQARNLSEKTLSNYREQLGWFAEYAADQGIARLQDFEPLHLKTYLVHLQDRGWKPYSRHAAFRALKTFFRSCDAEGWLEECPVERVRAPRLPELDLPAFSEDDIKRLFDSATKPRDRAIIVCLLDSGCRAGEFLNWDCDDVNIQTGVVRVRETKSKRPRTVYLGIKARRELIRYFAVEFDAIEPGMPVWRSDNTGERLQYYGLAIMLRKLGKSTGIQPCNPHRFRRSFALWSLRNGMNIYALQRLMGHSDITVLRHYLALVDDDLQRAHERFGAVDNLF